MEAKPYLKTRRLVIFALVLSQPSCAQDTGRCEYRQQHLNDAPVKSMRKGLEGIASLVHTVTIVLGPLVLEGINPLLFREIARSGTIIADS